MQPAAEESEGVSTKWPSDDNWDMSCLSGEIIQWRDSPISSLSLSVSTFGISCSSTAHSLASHGGWWPAGLMRRPDQRQKSSLGKTSEPRMDGISVGTTFPLGLLVVGTGVSCYQQKWQPDKRSDADAHTQTFCPTYTYTTPKALIRHLYFTSVSKLCFIQYLCATANLLNPPNPHEHFDTPPPHPPPQPFTQKNAPASSQRINRKPWHNPLLGRQRGFGWFRHPKWVSFFALGLRCF